MNRNEDIIKTIHKMAETKLKALASINITNLPILPSYEELPKDYWKANSTLLLILNQIDKIAIENEVLFGSSATTAVDTHKADADPHPNYLTEPEGNALYDSLGSATTAVDTHKADADPHPNYLTEPEGNALYDSLGSATTAVDTLTAVEIGAAPINHTHDDTLNGGITNYYSFGSPNELWDNFLSTLGSGGTIGWEAFGSNGSSQHSNNYGFNGSRMLQLNSNGSPGDYYTLRLANSLINSLNFNKIIFKCFFVLFSQNNDVRYRFGLSDQGSGPGSVTSLQVICENGGQWLLLIKVNSVKTEISLPLNFSVTTGEKNELTLEYDSNNQKITVILNGQIHNENINFYGNCSIFISIQRVITDVTVLRLYLDKFYLRIEDGTEQNISEIITPELIGAAPAEHTHSETWFTWQTNTFNWAFEDGNYYLISELFRQSNWPRFDGSDGVNVRFFANLATQDNPYYGGFDLFFGDLSSGSGAIRHVNDNSIGPDVVIYFISLKSGIDHTALVNHANINWFVDWFVVVA